LQASLAIFYKPKDIHLSLLFWFIETSKHLMTTLLHSSIEQFNQHSQLIKARGMILIMETRDRVSSQRMD
jgi:hypothetical protein